MTQIRKFIEDNKLSFEEGSRNSTVTILVGYAQHLGLKEEDLDDALQPEIDNDYFIAEETGRLFDYCKVRNYKNYWSTKDAKDKYIF